MPKAYSHDLRGRVMNELSLGVGKKEISKIFSLSIRTIDRWDARFRLTGNYKAKPHTHRKLKIENPELLKSSVLSKRYKTQKDLAKEYLVSQSTISVTLKRFGISYKKNFSVQREERKRSDKVLGRNS